MTTTAPTTAKLTLADIKAANACIGQSFFDKGNTRFFNAKYLPTVYQGQYGTYFVTAERADERYEYKYTVRQFDPQTGLIDTVGDFCMMSKDEARANAKLYAHFKRLNG